MGMSVAEMVEAVTRKLKENTGRTLEEWVAVLKKEGPKEAKEQRDWLRKTHGLGSTASMIVAESAQGGGKLMGYGDPEALVKEQYKGKKAALRPIYDALIHATQRIGKDVRISPCRTYVPLMRKNQFAVIQPTTSTRVDLGLALPGIEVSERLVKVRRMGGGDRITHRIPLETLKDVDAEVVRWLKRAYEETPAGKAPTRKPAPEKKSAGASKRAAEKASGARKVAAQKKPAARTAAAKRR